MTALSVKTGSPAPGITLRDEHEQPVALSSLWAGAERGIVVSFLRHYG